MSDDPKGSPAWVIDPARYLASRPETHRVPEPQPGDVGVLGDVGGIDAQLLDGERAIRQGVVARNEGQSPDDRAQHVVDHAQAPSMAWPQTRIVLPVTAFDAGLAK